MTEESTSNTAVTPAESEPPPSRSVVRVALRVLVMIVVAAGLLWMFGWIRYRAYYPYGYSHSCDKQLIFALQNYADAHGGAFPAGEATPEASLSLLYPKYAGAELLQGRSVPLEKVKAILESGQKLGADSCGWHYVEGLKSTDDRKIAVFWDKVGLGHNGERLSVPGHTVFYLNSSHDFIPESQWPAFLEEQKLLHEQRIHKLKAAVAK